MPPSGATPILALPYPIPDDTVDVPRDINALATKLDSFQIYLTSGIYTLMPAIGTVPEGARYYATDKGMTFQKISGAWALVEAEAVNWTSTTLPASPVVGQRISYSPAPGVRWLMRWTGTAWENEGGDGQNYWSFSEGPCQAITATPQIALPAVAIVIPNVGVWEFVWGQMQVTGINNASAGIILTSKPQGGGIAVITGPASAGVDQNTWSSSATGAGFGAFNSNSRKARFSITPAGSTVSMTYAHAQLTTAPAYYNRWMSARPITIT